ncbi:LysR family transcriptional regulator [Psychromonas aquimarina]|uniref:LysR family transcriptional regulator n=1 Tax=Psychromonas aquimarina TaxID=444919 RepID=UPI00042645E6|nr:LysR family transcriptional regulator [Psychromonas aquimarina]
MKELIDLNLMRMLVILCEKRSLKQTGIKLGVSESAVSKQLARLREQLNDVLFERTAAGLAPTEYTLSILPEVKKAILQIENVIQVTHFDAASYNKPIVIAMPASLLEAFGFCIYQRLQAHFPNAGIKLQTWSETVTKQIITADISLGLHYWHDETPSEIYQQIIRNDKLVVAIACNQGKKSWDEVKDWPFIKLLSYGWNEQRFRYIEHIKKIGITHNYQYDLDSLSLTLQFMKQDNIACVLPESTLGMDLIKVPAPKELELAIKMSSTIRLIDRSNPFHRYLHQLIKEAVC